MQRITAISIILVLSLSILNFNLIAQEYKKTEFNPINLYLHGETYDGNPTSDIKTGGLITEPPKTTEYTKGIIYHAGYGSSVNAMDFVSKQIQKPLKLKGDISITIWAVNDDNLPLRVSFCISIYKVVYESGGGRGYGNYKYTEEKELNGEPKEFTVNFNFSEIREELKTFDIGNAIGVGIDIQYIYRLNEERPHRPARIAILYYSIDYPSRAVVPLDSIEITQEVNISDKAIVNTNILSAFGNSDITNYTVQIIGENVNTVSLQVNESRGIQINLTWDYKKDNAKEGNYTVLISVKDGNGNLWQNSTYFELKYEKSKDGSFGNTITEILNDNLFFYIIIAVIGIITAIAVIIKRRKSK